MAQTCHGEACQCITVAQVRCELFTNKVMQPVSFLRFSLSDSLTREEEKFKSKEFLFCLHPVNLISVLRPYIQSCFLDTQWEAKFEQQFK